MPTVFSRVGEVFLRAFNNIIDFGYCDIHLPVLSTPSLKVPVMVKEVNVFISNSVVDHVDGTADGQSSKFTDGGWLMPDARRLGGVTCALIPMLRGSSVDLAGSPCIIMSSSDIKMTSSSSWNKGYRIQISCTPQKENVQMHNTI